MGVRIIEDSTHSTAVLYCSTSMWAFGPVFENYDSAQSFLDWLQGTDPRGLSDGELARKYSEWLGQKPCE